MKFYTSYFYQIRNFPKNIIPMSTAVWDPGWFHDNKGKRYVFRDKRGIYNGIRCELLVPGLECNNLCRGIKSCFISDPNKCDFLSKYKEQLDKIDFDKFIESLEEFSSEMATLEGLDNNMNIAFIFYEDPTNKCSERWKVQEWFKDNNYEIEEFKYNTNFD